MTITKISFEATVDVTRTIEHIAINERLVAVRVKQSGVLKDPTKIAQKRFTSYISGHKTEMVLTLGNLKKLQAGDDYKTEDLRPVSADFLESARTKGYVRAIEIHAKEFEKDKPTCFELLEAEEPVHMVHFDYGSHMLFDDEGKVLPTGLYYDYINGNMRNGSYDLAKTIDVLSKLPDVHVEGGKALAIQSVPHYNVSRGCSAFLSLIYGPTQEQMDAIWKKAQTLNKKYPSTALHQAAFELDIMGLRAAGAALGNTYYACTSDSDSNSDEDDDN